MSKLFTRYITPNYNIEQYEEPEIKRKVGRPKLYETEEERKIALREYHREYQRTRYINDIKFQNERKEKSLARYHVENSKKKLSAGEGKA